MSSFYCFSAGETVSAQLGAGGNRIVNEHQVQLLLTLLLVDGGDQHTAAGNAHHLVGRQVFITCCSPENTRLLKQGMVFSVEEGRVASDMV